MARRYRVEYVGNDSLDHVVFVTADDHESAAEMVERDYAPDAISDVRRAPKSILWPVVLWLVLVVSLAAAAYVATQRHKPRTAESTGEAKVFAGDDPEWGEP